MATTSTAQQTYNVGGVMLKQPFKTALSSHAKLWIAGSVKSFNGISIRLRDVHSGSTMRRASLGIRGRRYRAMTTSRS